MSRIVVLHPTTLVGKELVEALERHPDLSADLKLLSSDEEEVGQLTEAGGAAALVGAAESAAVRAADAVVVCGDLETYRGLLEARDPAATVVLLSPDATPDDGVPVVAGVNLDDARPGAVHVSPPAGALLLSVLLQPLAGHGLRAGVGTVIQPVSVYDRPGLDELFSQAGRMVAMQEQQGSELFGGRQLAFNLYPAPRPPRELARHVRAALGVGTGDLPLAVHTLQGAVFHGVSTLLHVELEAEVDAESLRQRLGASPVVELFEPEGRARDQLGPIDVAGHEKVLVGAVHADPEAGDGGHGYWIWAVVDNLTRGGALNALAILERTLG